MTYVQEYARTNKSRRRRARLAGILSAVVVAAALVGTRRRRAGCGPGESGLGARF